MNNELTKIIKTFSNNVLIVGFSSDSHVIKEIEKNKKIVMQTHLSSDTKKGKGKKKLFGNKKISIKKMYKELKKEKYDFILVELDVVKKYLDPFIYNSYKLTNNKIYFVLNDDLYNYKELMYRYERYNAKATSKGFKDDYIVSIELDNMKMKLYKRVLFRIRDIFYDILEFIASIIIA